MRCNTVNTFNYNVDLLYYNQMKLFNKIYFWKINFNLVKLIYRACLDVNILI